MYKHEPAGRGFIHYITSTMSGFMCYTYEGNFARGVYRIINSTGISIILEIIIICITSRGILIIFITFYKQDLHENAFKNTIKTHILFEILS